MVYAVLDYSIPSGCDAAQVEANSLVLVLPQFPHTLLGRSIHNLIANGSSSYVPIG